MVVTYFLSVNETKRESVKKSRRSGRAKMFLQFPVGTVACDRLAPEKVPQGTASVSLLPSETLTSLSSLSTQHGLPVSTHSDPSLLHFLGHSIKCLYRTK